MTNDKSPISAKRFHNSLIISILRGGRLILLLAVTCTLAIACTSGKPKSKLSTVNYQLSTKDDAAPIDVRASVVYNPDSLLEYARRAYLDDDAEGLFITGAAAYLRLQDPNFPDYCTTVPLWEANIMLRHAADLGHTDAARLIHCLQDGGCWEERRIEN